MPSASVPPTAEPIRALLELAVQELQAGRPAAAITPLRQAALLRPQAAMIHHDLGLACLETGLLQESVDAFRRATACDPRSADAHFRLAISLERLGDLGAALVAYHRATELKPSLTEAWYRAGALVHTLGHRDEAIACFERAAQSGSKTRFGRLGAARALLTAGRDREGERALRACVARDPENPLAHDLLGNLLAEAGLFEDALNRGVPAAVAARSAVESEWRQARKQMFAGKFQKPALPVILEHAAVGWNLCTHERWGARRRYPQMTLFTILRSESAALSLIALHAWHVQRRRLD